MPKISGPAAHVILKRAICGLLRIKNIECELLLCFVFFLEALLHSNFRAYFIVFFPDLPDILLETLANSVQEFYFGLLERTNQQILLKRKELNVSRMIYTFIFYILY